MLNLPNGCYCSNLAVHPKNWNLSGASLKKNWYISYRFYDPKHPKPKQVVIKGMNTYKSISERRSATKALLDNELNMLMHQGYNPFIGRMIHPQKHENGISQQSPFIEALTMAMHCMNTSAKTKTEIKSAIKGLEKAAYMTGIATMPISSVSRRHIKYLLQACSEAVPGWSANRYNSYRSYLMMLFNELIEQEATDMDPVAKIKKQATVKKLREVLQPENRKKVNDFLKNNYYTFWRFMQIFFHSGARESELVQLRKKDVDLAGQRFKVLIKKGNQYREVLKIIKTIALPYWAEIMKAAGPDDYLFAKGLNPGPVSISGAQINRRWKRHVKNKLGITADFYSLKHLNLDETAAVLNARDAAVMASHTTPVVTMNHYLVGEKQRQDERLKGVQNSFS